LGQAIKFVRFNASCVRRLRLRDFEWRLLGFGMTILQKKK
jgi:hypothetical protein